MSQYKRIFTIYFLAWLALVLIPAAYAVLTMDSVEALTRSAESLWRAVVQSR